MRILMLEPYPNIQGPLPKLVPSLTSGLRQAGCEVRVAHWGRHHDRETLWEKLRGRSADIRRIRSVLTRDRFDLLFVQTAHDWNTLLRDVPLLVVTRGLYRRAILQIHGSLLDWIEGENHKGFKVATRLLFNLCDGVLLSSMAEREVLGRFMPSRRFFVVDNIYRPETSIHPPVVPASWRLPTNRPIVFYAARLIAAKGISDLLTAMPAVLEQVACHLLVAGVGPIEEEVQARLLQPPLADHASCVGYLTGAYFELAYRLASVFVLPTYHNEGFPAVIQKALAHGLPIVTTPTRGIADHLIDGVHGLLIPPQDPEALAKALVTLLQHPSVRGRMSVANLKKIKDFSPEIVAHRYVHVLRQILASDE